MKLNTYSVWIFLTIVLLGVMLGSAQWNFQSWLKTHLQAADKANNYLYNQPTESAGIRTLVSVGRLNNTLPPEFLESKASSKSLSESVNKLAIDSRQQPGLVSSEQAAFEPDLTVVPKSQAVTKPALVVYPDELVFEFPKSLATIQNVKRAIARLLLSKDPFSESDWLSRRAIPLQYKPFFYKKILNQHGKPIRYPFDAYQYAEYLFHHAAREMQDDEGEFLVFSIPVKEKVYSASVAKYLHWVETFSKQFKVSQALIFAIMETESNFNPKAVSRSNAIGLMQLKAEAAGRDVYQSIDNRKGAPSKEALFDSENNIRMGTAYLSLLQHEYLSAVRNKESRQLLTIASYNGGLSTVLNLFAKSKPMAIDKINRLHPRQVYRTLRYQHESNETRRYLDKVLQAKDRYLQLLDEYV